MGAVRPVAWLCGAAMLVRPAAMRAVGGFDPAIFLYGEDVELGYQLRRAGWRLALDSRATATHAIGGSQAPDSAIWIGALDAYLARRGRSDAIRRACLIVMAAGLGARAMASSFSGTAGATHRIRMRAGALKAARRAFSRTI
jgi:hypothetical protein